MLLLLCLISNINLAFNDQSGCGCGVDRKQGTIYNNIRFLENVYKRGTLEQCPRDTYTIGTGSAYNQDSTMILVPSGKYQVGTDTVLIESDQEGPKRFVRLQSFYLDKYEVSNREFNRFISATGYKTEAEVFGDSFVFSLFLNSTFKSQLMDFRVVQAPWWYKVSGVDWKHPYGPDSNITGNTFN